MSISCATCPTPRNFVGVSFFVVRGGCFERNNALAAQARDPMIRLLLDWAHDIQKNSGAAFTHTVALSCVPFARVAVFCTGYCCGLLGVHPPPPGSPVNDDGRFAV